MWLNWSGICQFQFMEASVMWLVSKEHLESWKAQCYRGILPSDVVLLLQLRAFYKVGTWVWSCILNCSVYPVKVTHLHLTKSPQRFQKQKPQQTTKVFQWLIGRNVTKNILTCIVQMRTPKIAIVFLDEWAYSLSWFILVIHLCRMCATVIVIDDSEETVVTNPLALLC